MRGWMEGSFLPADLQVKAEGWTGFYAIRELFPDDKLSEAFAIAPLLPAAEASSEPRIQ